MEVLDKKCLNIEKVQKKTFFVDSWVSHMLFYCPVLAHFLFLKAKTFLRLLIDANRLQIAAGKLVWNWVGEKKHKLSCQIIKRLWLFEKITSMKTINISFPE